jgi:hypothetical protein
MSPDGVLQRREKQLTRPRKQPKKLALRTETLRHLEVPELAQVAGGTDPKGSGEGFRRTSRCNADVGLQ